MPTNKQKPVRRAKPSATQPLARLVEVFSETMATWVRQSAPERAQRPTVDRQEALLWSWPIRLDCSTRPPNPLWLPRVDDSETTWRCKKAIERHLNGLAETWYAETVYPETEYFSDWGSDEYTYPLSSPSKMADADFEHIGDQLRALPGIMVPDLHNDRRWLLALLEYGWGDGHLADRRDYQNMVVNGLPDTVRRQVCKLGERARDKAYIDVRINRCLDALHRTKEDARQFRAWLQDAKTHAPFVEEHLAERFSTEFHRTVERMTRALDSYMNNADQGRSRRATAGRQRRPWVDQARRALKDMKLSELHCSDLLIAWNLMPFPHPPR